MSTVTAVPLQPVKRSYLVYIWVGVAIACLAAFALARQSDDFLTRNARARGVVTTASGLQYQVIKPGAPGAARPTDADVALINYEGKLLNGTTFDKSQQPTPMPVAGVVPGFSEALKLMRRLVANAENVGRAFPEEARKIHYDEAPKRGIRGQASPEEAESLRDEGIDFMSLPGFLTRDLN